MSTDGFGTYSEGFETWAEFYETSDEIKAITSEVSLSGKKVLEVGMGSGRLTERLAPRADTYIGVDIDVHLVEYCNQKEYLPEDSDLLCPASGEDLPFPDDYFDIVLDGWAITAQNTDKAFPEYKRVVDPDGKIVLITESWDEYDREQNSDYVRLMREYDPDYDWYDLETELYEPMYKYFTSDQIKKKQITTEYRFPSQTAAFRAFEFHITQYHNRDFPEKRRNRLWKHLSSLSVGKNGPLQLSEHANLFVLTPNTVGTVFDDESEDDSEAIVDI